MDKPSKYWTVYWWCIQCFCSNKNQEIKYPNKQSTTLACIPKHGRIFCPGITQRLFRLQGSSAFGLTLATKSGRSGASRKRRRDNPRSRPDFLDRYVLHQLNQCVYIYICIFLIWQMQINIYILHMYINMDFHKLACLPIKKTQWN